MKLKYTEIDFFCSSRFDLKDVRGKKWCNNWYEKLSMAKSSLQFDWLDSSHTVPSEPVAIKDMNEKSAHHTIFSA